MEKTKTFWACPKCKREFAKGITPHHVRTFMNMDNLDLVEQPCAGRNSKTVEFDRDTRRKVK
jgi:hypothetical protein